MKKVFIRCLVFVVAVLCVGSGAMAGNKVAKPKSIVAFMDTTFITPAQGLKQFCEEYRKLTGVELKVIQPVHNLYYDRMRLAFAAGDVPDVVETGDLNYVKYAQDGAFIDLSKFVRKSDAFKKVKKDILYSTAIKGKLYGIIKEKPNGAITYIRQDWLDNLGLSVPRTWKDYYKVLKAFAEKDPDRDGKRNTYGFTGPGYTSGDAVSLDNRYYRDFYQNATPEFTQKRGKYVDGMMQPEFKSALERLRKVYQEKLIDPEILTNSTTISRDKYCSGKAGMFSYWAGRWDVQLQENMAANLGPKAKIVPMRAIRGSYYAAKVPACNSITVKCKNPEGAFKYFIEFMHDGGKGQMLFTHGVENVHWTVKNGTHAPLPSLGRPSIPFDKSYIAQELQLTPWDDPFSMDDQVVLSSEMCAKDSRNDLMMSFPASREKVSTQIYAAKNELLTRVMLGVVTVKEGLERYRMKCKQLNINKILNDMNR